MEHDQTVRQSKTASSSVSGRCRSAFDDHGQDPTPTEHDHGRQLPARDQARDDRDQHRHRNDHE
eukprot:758462-Pyramimonas_sp.AAC.1